MAGPCFSASLPRIPDPLLLLYLPDIGLSIPGFGITLCCTFKLPLLPLNITIPLGVLMAALGEAVEPIMLVIRKAIALINLFLDQLHFSFSCPFD